MHACIKHNVIGFGGVITISIISHIYNIHASNNNLIHIWYYCEKILMS